MKTQSMQWNPPLPTTAAPRAHRVMRWKLAAVTRFTARALAASAAAAALVILATWAVMQPELAPYLQAILWSMGFVFAALALESESATTALLELATAATLPALALVSARVAPEVAIVAATLLAVWVAAAILRR